MISTKLLGPAQIGRAAWLGLTFGRIGPQGVDERAEAVSGMAEWRMASEGASRTSGPEVRGNTMLAKHI